MLFGWWNLSTIIPLLVLLTSPNNTTFFLTVKLAPSILLMIGCVFSFLPPLFLASLGSKPLKPCIIALVAITITGTLCEMFPSPPDHHISIGLLSGFTITSLILSYIFISTLAKKNILTHVSIALSFSMLIAITLMIGLSDISTIMNHRNMENIQSDTSINKNIIFLIFDEFPLYFLFREDNTIDEENFPNISSLAKTSHWYKNASTPFTSTLSSITTMLTGTRENTRLPSYKNYPNNLFTLAGSAYDIHARETVTSLCPESLCHTHTSIISTSQDLLLLTLVATLRHYHTLFMDIHHKWKGFQHDDQLPQIVDDYLANIPAMSEKPKLLFFHLEELPHAPWTFLANGDFYQGISKAQFQINHLTENSVPTYRIRTKQMLHEARYADTLLGQFIDRIKALKLFDDSVIVLASDHGTYFKPNGFSNRNLSPQGIHAILPILFFIKAPNQLTGIEHEGSIDTTALLPMIQTLATDSSKHQDTINHTVQPNHILTEKPIYNSQKKHWATIQSTDIRPMIPNATKHRLLNEEVIPGYTEQELLGRKIDTQRLKHLKKISPTKIKDVTQKMNHSVLVGQLENALLSPGDAIVAMNEDQIVGVADITKGTNTQYFTLMIDPTRFPLSSESGVRLFILRSDVGLTLEAEILTD